MATDVNYEKELIKKYQRTHSVMVYKELERIFSGIIQKAVLDSGLSRYLADQSTITAEALALFRRAIESYTDAKGAKPSSYILMNIKLGLKNYKNREISDVAYRSEQMNRKSGLYYTALKELSTEQDINSLSDSDIVKHIKQMKTSTGETLGKDFTRNDIKKIRQTERNELMGNAIINQGVGEDISVHELNDNYSQSVHSIMQRQQQKNVIDSILKTSLELSPKQKNYIRRIVGIGRLPKAKNESQARINSGVTTTEAFRAKQIVSGELKKRGLGDL